MRWHYRLTWVSLRSIFATYFRWRVIGSERIPEKGAIVFASNHASFLDPPLVGCGTRREASYLARESLFRFPIIGSLLRAINALPVDRGGRSPRGLKSILDRLAQGEPVVLFPEGTRTDTGALLPARSGVGLTVVKSGAIVVPVRIFGSFEAYNRSMWFPRPRRIRVVYGQPIDFGARIEQAKTGSKAEVRELYQSVADEIMTAISRLKPDGSSE